MDNKVYLYISYLLFAFGYQGIIMGVLLPVSGTLRYNEVCFLTSHNSYAAIYYGYTHAQQTYSITKQLEYGVRGLMLDTYRVNKTGEIVVCHGKFFTSLIKKNPPMALVNCLTEIKEFLDTHPSEIITIFLENYVSDLSLLDKAFVSATISDYILRPADWDRNEQGGWPPLDWLREQNKRLIIFNSNGDSPYMFNEWKEVIENQFGTLRMRAAARERKESRLYENEKRYLYLINYIPTFKINFGNSFSDVNNASLKRFLEYIFTRGLGKREKYKGKLPNFINIDYVEQGDALALVNKINAITTNAMVWKSHN